MVRGGIGRTDDASTSDLSKKYLPDFEDVNHQTLRFSAIAIGDLPYWALGGYCHPEVVASATPDVNRYPRTQSVRTPTQCGKKPLKTSD